MHDSESPRSISEGAGRDGGGVEARDGRGEEARDESTGGVSGAVGSRDIIGGWSRR